MLLRASIVGVTGLAVSWPSLSPAQEPAGEALDATAVYGELHGLSEVEERATRSGHISFGVLDAPMKRYFEWKASLAEDHGFNYMIEISPQYQLDISQGTGSTSNNETNFIVQWALRDRSDFNRGGLLAWYQWAHTLGSRTTTEFQRELGILLPVNGGDTAPANSADRLFLLAWEQWFLEDRVRFDVGKLTTRVLLDLNRYAVSDREDFFTPVIVNNPVVPNTARLGLGAFAQYLSEDWYLGVMVREADGTSEGLSFDTLDTGNWEYAVEFALTPSDFLGLGEGIYRFIPYYTDGFGSDEDRQPAGWTWSLSFDQDVGDRLGLAFRYARAGEAFRQLKQRASLSMQIKRPLGFEHDRVGIGLFWGEPWDERLGSETGLDLFWKVQLARSFELSPGLQLIFDPALDPDSETAWIAELRLRLVL